MTRSNNNNNKKNDDDDKHHNKYEAINQQKPEIFSTIMRLSISQNSFECNKKTILNAFWLKHAKTLTEIK